MKQAASRVIMSMKQKFGFEYAFAPGEAPVFREKAVKYCRKHKILESEEGIKNNRLYQMVIDHAKLPISVNILVFLEKELNSAVTSNSNTSNEMFFESREWYELRYRALKRHGARCQCCGATPSDGVKMHVDHIKPRSKFPELQWDIDNLQVLCEKCNLGKGAWDCTDWRIAR